MSISPDIYWDKTYGPLGGWDEQIMFRYIQSCCYPDLVKAKNQMSRWDCYSVDTKHRIELKCRKKHYDSLMLEKKKYDAMITKCSDHGDIPMYINSTPRGIYRFNLYEFKPEWKVMYLGKTTEFGERHRVPKEVAMIPVVDAITLK